MMRSWSNLVSETRAYMGSRSGFDERSEFERDYDRLIYASPFRRLQDKAQVFPLEHNDFVRTRLTHSLEVSTLGRSLGRQVGRRLRKDRSLELSIDDISTVVATTCLAHDIGNPPFGHFGEDAIRRWFERHLPLLDPLEPAERADFLNFDGNVSTAPGRVDASDSIPATTSNHARPSICPRCGAWISLSRCSSSRRRASPTWRRSDGSRPRRPQRWHRRSCCSPAWGHSSVKELSTDHMDEFRAQLLDTIKQRWETFHKIVDDAMGLEQEHPST